MPATVQKRRLILIVDDQWAIIELLRMILQAEGHEIITARDGLEALDRVAERLPDLVLLDVDMPRMNGLEACRRLKNDPKTSLLPIMFLTGTEAPEARLRGWEFGADEFLTKPFRAADVTARCRSLLRQKDLIDALDSAESVVFSLARTIEAKSRFTHGHSSRVGHYSLALAERIGLGEMETMRRGAALHDIGKISIPDAILDKPGSLTAQEYEIVRRHPLDGARIVEPLRSVRDCLPLIRSHHERLDGRGYPDGLTADAITTPIRVISVADVYDALSSERPYRPAMPHEKCREVMLENAASGGLDMELVHVFFETITAPVVLIEVSTPP